MVFCKGKITYILWARRGVRGLTYILWAGGKQKKCAEVTYILWGRREVEFTYILWARYIKYSTENSFRRRKNAETGNPAAELRSRRGKWIFSQSSDECGANIRTTCDYILYDTLIWSWSADTWYSFISISASRTCICVVAFLEQNSNPKRLPVVTWSLGGEWLW